MEWLYYLYFFVRQKKIYLKCNKNDQKCNWKKLETEAGKKPRQCIATTNF